MDLLRRIICVAFFLNFFIPRVECYNDWPIIGLFSQPSYDDNAECGGECLYIAASYVKYLEAAGARVVPINYFSTDEEMDSILSKVNGIFFPGGGAVLPKAAVRAFDYIKTAHDNGDYMPLWGTCMGFQWLLELASGDSQILDPSDGTQMDAYNYSIPLDMTENAPTSRLFSNMPESLYTIAATENVTMNNHHYGIWTQHFKETESLNSFFNLLSTNNDRAGNEFVSSIESFKYPIYGAQWHPEKNNFEWQKSADGTPKEAINHSPQAVLLSQYTAEFLVQEARKNNHFYENWEQEDAALIWNYPVTKTQSSSFVQKYYFKLDF